MKTRPVRGAAAIASALALAAAALPVRSADEPPSPYGATSPASDRLSAARAHIAAARWPQAIAELRRVNATGDANWQNLMGYSLRKQATPDLEGAQRHYDAALRIDPNHRWALEYAGELALMKGDLDRAVALLARLDAVCPTGCEERADLARAIERYRAAGGRHVPG